MRPDLDLQYCFEGSVHGIARCWCLHRWPFVDPFISIALSPQHRLEQRGYRKVTTPISGLQDTVNFDKCSIGFHVAVGSAKHSGHSHAQFDSTLMKTQSLV